MRYIYDFDDTLGAISGYEKIGEKLVLSGVRGDMIFIVNDTKSFAKAYKCIKKALSYSTSTRVIFIGDIEDEYKQLCMLMMTYKNYDVYNVEDVSEIEEEYLDTICDRECTADEIETFFGPEMAVYPEMREILIRVADSIKAGDTNNLISFLSLNADKIASMAGLAQFMQRIIDELSMQCGTTVREDDTELKRMVDKLRGELSRAKAEYDIVNRKTYEKEKEIDTRNAEIAQLREKVDELTLATAGNTVSNVYTSLSLDIFTNTSMASGRTPKVREVIYFKEINPCKYINTFVVLLHTVLSVINGIETKLMIYDNKEFNNIKYKPLKVLDLEKYMREKDIALTKIDKFVVIEPSRVILEDALMSKECVIIYDRLGKEEDLLTGKHVHKYLVVNSVKDIHALESVMKVDKSKIVTNIGVSKQCISIRDVKEFKALSVNGKVSAYLNMLNLGEDNRAVFDIIIDSTGLNRLIRR